MSWIERVAEALPEVARRAGRDTIATLAARLDALARQEGALGEAPEVTYGRLLPRLTREMLRIEDEDAEMRDSLAIARAQGDKRGALVEMLSRLGGPGLEADLAAIDRYLDIEAVEDRLLLRIHSARQQWEFLALALAHRARGALDDDSVVACRDAAQRVLAGIRRPWPLRVAACVLAGRLSAEAVPGAASVRQNLLSLTHAVREDPWVQAAALRAWLTLQDDPDDVERVLRGVLLPPPSLRALLPETHAFLRARAAGLAAEHERWDLLQEALGRPMDSEHVAGTIARALATSPRPQDSAALVTFVRNGRVDRAVRGAAVVEALGAPEAPGDPDRWAPLVTAALGTEEAWLAELIVRAVLDRLPAYADAAVAHRAAWRPALDRWSDHASVPDLANAAWLLARSLDVYADPAKRAALEAVQAWTLRASEGDSAVYSSGPIARLAPDALLDVLAVAAADGFDLSADPRGGHVHSTEAPRRGYRLHLGTPPRFAWWRLAYEALRPRPDKRQAWSFVTDRWPSGALVAMSTRLAEVTPTLVPGIRQGTPTRLDWGQALPLPSLLLAASRPGGIRVVGPRVAYDLGPKGSAWRARAAVHRGYVHLADLRLRMLGGVVDDPVRAWDAVVAETGLEVKRPTALHQAIPLPFVVLDDLAANLVALDSNTVEQMAALSVAVTALWVGRSLVRREAENRWRNGIPLVIGGWGSRGKSGTERLKAAVFHGLGYSVLSKTTGCEAMVVSSIPGREPTEIFLYRPYDKATIFEQRNVMRLAYRMGPQVFLWECMALNPSYVEILQQDWVRDDFTTLTNTYPDHEDIQGPSGRDVADVISGFIPYGGEVVTSEQHMTPVLEQQARARKSSLAVVRPEEWMLLPKDLLARYPYNEHPRNIALVIRLMARLGIERDVAMRAMADHVVPDLGVLKEYGPVPYDGRTASFVCGNSANERAGFVSNWTRMGFDETPEDAGLRSFQITKVNNRADRLARQGVFAKIAALDAPTDALVVIGTNVMPFYTQYLEALDVDLRDRMNDVASDRPKLLADIARRLRRRPWAPDDCRRITGDFGADPADVDRWIAAYYTDDPGPEDLVKMRARELPFEGPTVAQTVEQWVRETGWLHRLGHTEGWSTARVIDGFLEILRSRARPLSNSALTGDQVLHQIVTTAPPGAEVRIMGSANIKGTGLDFVYRWLSVQRVLGLTAELGAVDPETFKLRVRALAAHPNYGVADTRVAVKALREALGSGRGKGAGLEDEVGRTVKRLAEHLDAKEKGLQTSVEASRLDRVRRWLSQAVDFWDSIARRRESDLLYDDLAARRVGQEDAAKVAKALVYRKK